MPIKGLSAEVQNNVALMNLVRDSSTLSYQERIPVATQENMVGVGNAIISYEATRNEFLHNIMNRIGMVVLKNRMLRNPLAPFKRGELANGDTIEEIFVNIAKAHAYNPVVAETELYKRVLPDVRARFHKVNRRDFYKTTFSDDQLRAAFLSEYGISDLFGKVIDSLYNGDAVDEFILMKNLFKQYNDEAKFAVVQVTAPTDEETAKEFVQTLREYSLKLAFPSDVYNIAGVVTATPLEDQVLFIDPKVESVVGVQALAYAFNINQVDYLARRVLVDDFGGVTNVGAVLVDKEWFMVFDNFYDMKEKYNEEGLYRNYWWHHWQILSTSDFANAILFTTATTLPTVTSVTVTPDSVASGKVGGVYQFSASVTGTNSPSQAVTWSLESVTSNRTYVDDRGTVYVGFDETSSSITVRATANADTSKSGTATITIA